MDFEKLKQKKRSINFLKDVQFSFEYAAKKVKTDTVNIINPVLKIFQAENAGEDPVELTEDNPESLYLIKPEEMARFVVETGVPNMPVTSSGLIIAFADNSGGGGNPLPNPKLGTTITIPPTQNITDSEGKLYFETNFEYDLFGNHEAKVVVFIEEPVQRSIVQFFEKHFLFRVLNVEHKIYQVIENPNLEDLVSPSTDKVIDLVAGKNADIVVKLVGPNGVKQNVALSTIKIGDFTEDYKPKTPETDENGEVVFEITPVPEVLNQELDLKIHIKDTQGETLGMAQSKVKIWKTKQMKINFLAIGGCISPYLGCFTGATPLQARELATNSKPFTLAQLPVADDQYLDQTPDWSFNFAVNNLFPIASLLPIPIGKHFGNLMMIFDFVSLARWLNISNYFGVGNSDFLIGVVTEDYFKFRYNSTDLGFADAKAGHLLDISSGRVMLIRYDSPVVPLHELGHLFGLEHSEECGPSSNDSLKIDSYSNYELPIWWNIKRGRIGKKCRTMSPNGGSGFVSGYWISNQEYLKFFKKGIISNKKQELLQNILKINGYNVDEKFGIIGARFSTGLENTSLSGKYSANVLDINNNIIKTVFFNSTDAKDSGVDSIELNIALSSDAAFLEFYIEERSRKLLKKIVINSEILKEEIRFLTQPLVKESLNGFQQRLNNYIKDYEEEILAGDFRNSFETLMSKIAPEIRLKLKSYSEVSLTENGVLVGLTPDKNRMSEVITSSYLRLISIFGREVKASNGLISINQYAPIDVYKKSKIKIESLIKPKDGFEYEFKAWINGQETKVYNSEGFTVANSNSLSEGAHLWSVQAYLTNQRDRAVFNRSLAVYNQKKYQLELELESETDLDKRNILLKQSAQINNYIRQIRLNYDYSLKPVGEMVMMNIEVL